MFNAAQLPPPQQRSFLCNCCFSSDKIQPRVIVSTTEKPLLLCTALLLSPMAPLTLLTFAAVEPSVDWWIRIWHRFLQAQGNGIWQSTYTRGDEHLLETEGVRFHLSILLSFPPRGKQSEKMCVRKRWKGQRGLKKIKYGINPLWFLKEQIKWADIQYNQLFPLTKLGCCPESERQEFGNSSQEKGFSLDNSIPYKIIIGPFCHGSHLSLALSQNGRRLGFY